MEKIYSTEEAAEVLGLNVETVRNWLRAGRIKGVKLGKRYWRIPEREVQRLVFEPYAKSGEGQK